MPEKVKKTKPPVKLRRFVADDLSVEVDGETYYPHAGEEVVFNRRPSWGFMSASALIGTGAAEGFVLINEEVVNAIDSWTWTGPDDEPLPSPSLAVFGELSLGEVTWLITAYAKQEGDPKNA